MDDVLDPRLAQPVDDGVPRPDQRGHRDALALQMGQDGRDLALGAAKRLRRLQVQDSPLMRHAICLREP